jgi:hypothetical protein
MDLNEVRKTYALAWVACAVKKRDENGQPVDVDVIAVSADRVSIREKVMEQNDICIFYGGDTPMKGYLMML